MNCACVRVRGCLAGGGRAAGGPHDDHVAGFARHLLRQLGLEPPVCAAESGERWDDGAGWVRTALGESVRVLGGVAVEFLGAAEIRFCPQRYCWHSWKNATQTAAISWRLTGGGLGAGRGEGEAFGLVPLLHRRLADLLAVLQSYKQQTGSGSSAKDGTRSSHPWKLPLRKGLTM